MARTDRTPPIHGRIRTRRSARSKAQKDSTDPTPSSGPAISGVGRPGPSHKPASGTSNTRHRTASAVRKASSSKPNPSSAAPEESAGNTCTEYDIGYGRPPEKTRFRPGQSGNPRGRPKGSKNFETEFLDEMSQRVTIVEKGRKINVSKQRALIKYLFQQAVAGNAKAFEAIHKLIERYGDRHETSDPEPVRLSAADQAIMDELLGTRAAEVIAQTATDEQENMSDG